MELTAERIVAGGDALAHAPDGRVVLVDGALPGERVRIEVTSDRADLLRGRVVEIVDPSRARVEPPCPYARAGCGGCSWQHVAPDVQPALKLDIVRDALRRIAHVDGPPLTDPVTLPTTGFRTTVRLLVTEDGRTAFRRRHAHDPVAVDSCLVAHPLLDELLHGPHFDGAREVTLRVGVATGERAALPDPVDTSLDLPAGVAVGRGARVHEVVAGHRFRISIESFFQTRVDGAEVLARVVGDAVGPDRTVADLYCGVGLFAATIPQPRRVVAVERGRAASADAKHNLRDRPARVVRADVGRWKGAPAEVVVADPSRAGVGRDGARTIARCNPERVVLVSCDAAALARDVALLGDAGFTLRTVTLVDLFAHSPHVECVSVLER